MNNPRVAVVGCGYWGRNLARNFHDLGALEAVCEVDPVGQDAAREIAPGVRIEPDLDRLLELPDTAGIVVATPAETHHAIARRALEAGKDVLVEKPLALNYSQGKELVDLAARRGRILMVGHVLEYHPGIACLMELFRSGELGKIFYIYSNRLSLGKIRREENILWSFAPHDIAVILRLTGELPFQVAAAGGSYLQPNIADVTVTNLLFNNGVRAHIYVSWLHPFKEQRLVVVGSRKMAGFDDVHKRLVLYDQRVEFDNGEPVPVRSSGDVVEYPATEPLHNECRAFLESMSTRTSPLTDGASGLKVLKVLDAAQRSLIMNGEPITLPMEPFLENRDDEPRVLSASQLLR